MPVIARPTNYASAIISGRFGGDVVLTTPAGRKGSSAAANGGAYSNAASLYGASVTLLRPPLNGVDECYDDDDIVKVAPPCDNGLPYIQPNDAIGGLQQQQQQPRRPLPEVPRIPVDVAGQLKMIRCFLREFASAVKTMKMSRVA